MTVMAFSMSQQTGSTTWRVARFDVMRSVWNGVFRTPGVFEDDAFSEPREMLAVPQSQLYFWTEAWQRAERESLDELARGEGVEFDDAADAVSWLLAAE